jgi:hypothetical protein
VEKFVLRSIKTALFLTTLALAACSGSGLEEVYGIDSNTQVLGSFSQYDNAKITGTGRVRFTSPLPIASSRSFSLKAALDQNITTSSVSVIFYSSDATVPDNNGVIVKFARNGVNVDVTVSIGNSSSAINSSKTTFFYPAALDVVIDVHNVGSKSRVVIWRRDTVGYSAASADVDTSRTGDLVGSLPTSTGGGGFVGLSLTNATVSAAKVSSQYLLD